MASPSLILTELTGKTLSQKYARKTDQHHIDSLSRFRYFYEIAFRKHDPIFAVSGDESSYWGAERLLQDVQSHTSKFLEH